MKKNLGFTSFEFYFVMSAIGLVVLVGLQRYLQLAEETQRFSFEVIAKHFNASVYNHHARWIMAQQQQTKVSELTVENIKIQFSPQGWPVSIAAQEPEPKIASLKGCLSLWNNLLQNPPSISYEGGDAYGTRAYHLSFSPEANCRFEFITDYPAEFYFDYEPLSGKVMFHSPPLTKSN
jgi:hypothetical protein